MDLRCEIANRGHFIDQWAHSGESPLFLPVYLIGVPSFRQPLKSFPSKHFENNMPDHNSENPNSVDVRGEIGESYGLAPSPISPRLSN